MALRRRRAGKATSTGPIGGALATLTALLSAPWLASSAQAQTPVTSPPVFHLPPRIALTGRSILSTGRYVADLAVVVEPPTGATDPVAGQRASVNVTRFAVPQLVTEAKQDQGALIDTVTGATFTSRAFASSLQGAIVKVAKATAPTALVLGPVEPVAAPCSHCGRYGLVELRVTAAPAAVAVAADGRGGYWVVNSLGHVTGHGGAVVYGQPAGVTLGDPVVGMAASADARGYAIVDRSGEVFSYGDAPRLGGMSSSGVVGIAMAPTGKGYWLVTAAGAVRAFGAAARLGSLSGQAAGASDVVAMAASASGRGYWLVTSQGVVHGFGDAIVRGAPPALTPSPQVFDAVSPGLVTGIVSSPRDGYLLVTSGSYVYQYGPGFACYSASLSRYGVLPPGMALPPGGLPPGATVPGQGLLDGAPVVGIAAQAGGKTCAVVAANAVVASLPPLNSSHFP